MTENDGRRDTIQTRPGNRGAGQTGDIQRGGDFYHGGSGATSAYENSKKGLDIIGVYQGEKYCISRAHFRYSVKEIESLTFVLGYV